MGGWLQPFDSLNFWEIYCAVSFRPSPLINTFWFIIYHFLGQPQGQDGVKVQSSPVTVTVGNVASGSSMSPDQLGSVQSSSDQEGPPSKRLRRVACSCPNCRDGEGR